MADKNEKPPTLKRFKVSFDVRGTSHRIVQALDAEEARQSVNGDMIDHADCEHAELESICVDDVEELTKTVKFDKTLKKTKGKK